MNPFSKTASPFLTMVYGCLEVSWFSGNSRKKFDRMASRRVLDFFKAQRLNGRLMKKLRIFMLIVNEVLNDAEEKQITKAYVKEWLDELIDTAYYEAARDLLD
ncbi:hypothetical protein Peur_022582 [Populus x canadensis]